MARKKKKGNQSKALQSIALATAILTLIHTVFEFLTTLVELLIKLIE